MNGIGTEENFLTASDIAYRIISQKIFDGEFQPGMKLSRRKMAEVTGVSVIPVIEALKKLEEDNLVESRPQWGSYVIVPTRARVIQNFQLREAVECQSARILAQSMTKEQRERLMEIATELDTVPYTKDTVIDSRNSHMLFHTKLTEFTGNDLLASTLRKINLFWLLSNAIAVNAPRVTYPRYWHRYLVDVIGKGDPDEAEKVMRTHVNDSMKLIIATYNT
ncbi:MAG: GntR family transcriptional regulator [Fusobacteriaceae bacterium]|jgi:DNA-binding GntR family transcriptional regulator|nr:GntR family transcriptional regulator [Fusobacteriaceae bacterium]